MSLKNGYTDLLFKFGTNGAVRVVGASPDGIEFLKQKFGAGDTIILDETVGPLVNEAVVSRRLSLTITGSSK